MDGALDLTMGGKIATKLKNDEYEKQPDIKPDEIRRRSVYIPLVRNKLPSILKLFDFVDPSASTAKRTESNIAPQALFMMNSDFIRQRSRAFAEYLLASNADEAARMERAYWIALSRGPDPQEAEQMLAYIHDYPGPGGDDHETDAWQSFCRMILASNEFHYVD